MYSRRSGFIRRSNSARLTRQGATQYIRDLNNSGVPPYTINQGMIVHAQNILSATGNAFVMSPVRTTKYAGRTLSKRTEVPPTNTVRVTDQVELKEVNVPISSSDTSNTVLIDQENITMALDMPSLIMTENYWRNAFEIRYEQSLLYNENIPWKRSLRFVFVPYEASYASINQSAINCDINFDNDEEPTRFTITNSTGKYLCFYFCYDQYNPQEAENPFEPPQYIQTFPMEFTQEEEGVNTQDPTYFFVEEGELTSRAFPDYFHHFPIALSTEPPNRGEANAVISFPSVKIGQDGEKYILEEYKEDSLGDHVSTPSTIEFTLQGFYTDLVN